MMPKSLTIRNAEVITPGPTPLSNDLKIVKAQIKLERIKANREIMEALLRNPAFAILVSYLILEICQNKLHVTSGGLAGGFEEGAVMTGVVATVGLQQIAPLIPDILKSGSEGLAALLKVIPSLAALPAA